jgi:hypothetical protein
MLHPSSLILMSALLSLSKEGARLEGWMHGIDALPSFETHRSAMLLRMRSEK